jgi:hypothetical protein
LIMLLHILWRSQQLLRLQYSGGYQRTGSPGLILREYKSSQYPEDISRIYTYSYLTEEPTQGYLKRPIDPYDKPPTSPHFHRPSCEYYKDDCSILPWYTELPKGLVQW